MSSGRFVRNLRNYDANLLSHVTGVDTGSETLVQQQFAEEVDVNTIVRRFGMGYPMPVVDGAVYGDFTGVTDYESAEQAVLRARESFMLLPAATRERFDNSPAKFLQFAETMTPEALTAELGFVPAAPVPLEPVVATSAVPSGGDAPAVVNPAE